MTDKILFTLANWKDHQQIIEQESAVHSGYLVNVTKNPADP